MSDGEITYEYDARTGRKVELFPGGVVPEPIQIVFAARWLQGAASIEWLIAHPEWAEWVDICSIAHEQATADRAREQQPTG